MATSQQVTHPFFNERSGVSLPSSTGGGSPEHGTTEQCVIHWDNKAVVRKDKISFEPDAGRMSECAISGVLLKEDGH